MATTEKAMTQTLAARSSDCAARNGWTIYTPDDNKVTIDQVSEPDLFICLFCIRMHGDHLLRTCSPRHRESFSTRRLSAPAELSDPRDPVRRRRRARRG